jgi:L-ascorbate metabolism protein UlaG (beta-lactamase superfamily)
MKITWYGHSCFVVESDGYRIAIDPYDDSVGYPPLRISAHMVLTTHDHHDHNNVSAVTILPEKENPFSIRTVASVHDDCGGRKRGKNTIYVLSAEGQTVVHLGDLGAPLTEDQKKEIGACDAVMVPVGGYYTIDGKTAKAVADSLSARVVIPMHYKFGKYGYPEISGIAPFLLSCEKGLIHSPESNAIILTGDTPAQVCCLSVM